MNSLLVAVRARFDTNLFFIQSVSKLKSRMLFTSKNFVFSEFT